MFSGIIRELGIVEKARGSAQGLSLVIRSKILAKAAPGDSVSVSGACLTVTSSDGEIATFDVIEETIRRTNLGKLAAGSTVNLELSLALGDLLHGHLVQGHVDCVSTVSQISAQGDSQRVVLSLPSEIAPFIVAKGSVTVDGVSLTVGEVKQETFSVYLIPHTVQLTTLQSLRPGALVNVEADCIAKYLQQLSQPYLR